MPNWCNNFVEVSHEDPAKIKALAEAFNRGEFCDHVIPVPQELKDTVSGYHADPEEQRKLEEQTRANIEKYGAGNWYDFCVNRWGTKWDVGGEGQAYGQTYYCVEPLMVVTSRWTAMEAWLEETMGPMGPSTGSIWSEHPAPNPGERWYANNSRFWFRDEQDRVLFLLRWL